MADKFDFKKEYADLYMPSTAPSVIDVPQMVFIAVDGSGDPNTGAPYKEAMELLYGLSYSIKMSKMSGQAPAGYYEYVVPPLEGLWWTLDGGFDGRNIVDKSKFLWTSLIRQPEFVTPEVFAAAQTALLKKRPEADIAKARLVRWREGLCAQVLHKGPYDDEPQTVARLEEFIERGGWVSDISAPVQSSFDYRRHHEIYLGDPRRTAPEKRRTVIRHPIVKKTE